MDTSMEARQNAASASDIPHARYVSQVGQDRMVLHKHIPLTTPLVIYVEPSGYCNLRCLFCPQSLAVGQSFNDVMPPSLFYKLIDDLAEFPECVKLIRVCGNGEPLLNPDLPDMLRYAKDRNIAQSMEMVTNATLWDSERIRQLPAFLDRIICSVEGVSADEYERICGVKIDFAKYVLQLEELYQNRKGCRIHIKIHQDAVTSQSARQTFFSVFSPMCDEIFIENLVPMWPQYHVDSHTGQSRWGGDVVGRKVCAQIFKGMQVQANGDVVPCCVDWDRANLLGNLQDASLRSIWRSSALKQLQIAHLSGMKGSLVPCAQCAMNDYCEVDNLDAYARECLQRITGSEKVDA